jgi:hypothetical protein
MPQGRRVIPVQFFYSRFSEAAFFSPIFAPLQVSGSDPELKGKFGDIAVAIIPTLSP